MKTSLATVLAGFATVCFFFGFASEASADCVLEFKVKNFSRGRLYIDKLTWKPHKKGWKSLGAGRTTLYANHEWRSFTQTVDEDCDKDRRIGIELSVSSDRRSQYVYQSMDNNAKGDGDRLVIEITLSDDESAGDVPYILVRADYRICRSSAGGSPACPVRWNDKRMKRT
jgi:hypothetical protein